MKLEDPEVSTVVMSRDANAFVYSEVLEGAVGAVQRKDLSTAYYEAAVTVFEAQIA